jgi:hypothetical protein
MKLRDALESGQLAAVDEELDRLARLAAESRRTYYRWCLLVLQAARAVFAGRLAEGERLAEEAVALNRRHGEDADQEHTVQRLALAQLRRRPQDAPLPALREYAARYPGLPVWEAMLAQAEHGLRPSGARRSVTACAGDGFAAILRTPDWLCALALLAEPVAALGSPEQIDRLGEALAPHADRNAVMDDAWAAFGPVARPLGVLAAAAGRHEDAARHFQQAVALAERWSAPGWELAAIADWGRSAPLAGALRTRGLALARDLELPWVAAELDRAAAP